MCALVLASSLFDIISGQPKRHKRGRDVIHVIVHLLTRTTIMSVASPTVLPRSALFPTLLPRPPQPHPTPLQKYGKPGRLNSRRNLLQEMDDLSDEEDELDDLVRPPVVFGVGTYLIRARRRQISGIEGSTSWCRSGGHTRSMRKRTTRV